MASLLGYSCPPARRVRTLPCKTLRVYAMLRAVRATREQIGEEMEERPVPATNNGRERTAPIAGGRIRACLITNPHSSHGAPDLTEPLRILLANGWDVEVREKHHGGEATKLARQAAKDGCNVVVDCGGDGTLDEIVDGVMGTDVAVGTLPGGTENVWAKEAGISLRLDVAATQLAGAVRHRVDVGQLVINGSKPQHFILFAGLGFDGALEEHVSTPLKDRIGKAAIVLAGVEAIPALRRVPVRVELDGVHWEGKVCQIVLGNIRKYGGFTQMTPEAYMDDGQLDVCLITAGGPIALTRQALSLLLAQHPNPQSAELYRAAHVRITAPELLPVQVDGGGGDFGKIKPGPDGVVYEASVVAQAVTLLVPRTYDGRLFVPARAAPELHLDTLKPVKPSKPMEAKARASNTQGTMGKRKRWTVRALTIGPSSIMAVRVKNGKPVTLLISPRTTLRTPGGAKLPLWGALDALSSGDLLRVRGRKDKTVDGTLYARRITLLAEDEGTERAKDAK